MIGLDWGFSGFGEYRGLLIFILWGEYREIHVTDFENRFFLKNVLINNQLIIIFFREHPAIPGSLLRVSLFALNRYH